MALHFRLPRPSFAFFLQAAPCLFVAWSLWNGGLTAPGTPGGIEQPPGAAAPDAATFNPFKDGAADGSPAPAGVAPAGSGATATPPAPSAHPPAAASWPGGRPPA